jgi:hypothetical protein
VGRCFQYSPPGFLLIWYTSYCFELLCLFSFNLVCLNVASEEHSNLSCYISFSYKRVKGTRALTTTRKTPNYSIRYNYANLTYLQANCWDNYIKLVVVMLPVNILSAIPPARNKLDTGELSVGLCDTVLFPHHLTFRSRFCLLGIGCSTSRISFS